MRFNPIIVALVLATSFVTLARSISLAQVEVVEKGLEQPQGCGNNTVIKLSGVYAPYSVHLIKAEVSGRVNKVNAKEGQLLPAGTPIMEIEHTALTKELNSLEQVLEALAQERKVLLKNLELVKRKFGRYLKLKREGHVEEQIVEDVESQVNSAEMALIANKQKQAETKRAIWELKDKIKKSRPCFDKPLYVSQNFKELYETVVPGENLSRLLDVSKAKIHLVLSLSCFKVLEKTLSSGRKIHFSIILPDNRTIEIDGNVEKLKLDPDNSYLYSYGFDLIFQPIPGLLWGQVVRVELRP